MDEFGGLSIEFLFAEKRKRGTHLDSMSMIIDPILLSGENQSIDENALTLGHPLYPLGELNDPWYDQYAANILIDDMGRVFIVAFWATFFIGETFDSALENILSGKEGKIVDNDGHW